VDQDGRTLHFPVLNYNSVQVGNNLLTWSSDDLSSLLGLHAQFQLMTATTESHTAHNVRLRKGKHHSAKSTSSRVVKI